MDLGPLSNRMLIVLVFFLIFTEQYSFFKQRERCKPDSARLLCSQASECCVSRCKKLITEDQVSTAPTQNVLPMTQMLGEQCGENKRELLHNELHRIYISSDTYSTVLFLGSHQCQTSAKRSTSRDVPIPFPPSGYNFKLLLVDTVF